MNKKILTITLILIFSFSIPNNSDTHYYIEKTNEQFNLVKDYKVDMVIKLDIPGFRMPRKKYKVYYMNPNMIKVESKGFGILPKTGIFTSPSDNFDNLKNISLSSYSDPLNINDILIVGELIVDSLKLDMPNEYSRLTFKPTVEVRIDTLNWVIKNVTTKLDTLKLFQINNTYLAYDNQFYMPSESVVKYYVKDEKLFNWINKDAGSIINDGSAMATNTSIVEGTIKVNYENYIINKGLDKKLFD